MWLSNLEVITGQSAIKVIHSCNTIAAQIQDLKHNGHSHETRRGGNILSITDNGSSYEVIGTGSLLQTRISVCPMANTGYIPEGFTGWPEGFTGCPRDNVCS